MCIQPTAQHSSPSTFHLFTFLPSEIRLAIYALSLPAPRLLNLTYQTQTYSGGLPPARRSQNGCTSSAPIPALLHVCRESRAMAANAYSLSFQLCGMGTFPAKVWFRLDGADVVYFGPREGLEPGDCFQHFVNLVSMVGRKELGKIRRLAMHEGLFVRVERKWKSRGQSQISSQGSKPDLLLRQFWDYVRMKFTNVEEVIFVRSGHEEHVVSEVERHHQLPHQLLEDEEGSWEDMSLSQSHEESLKDFSISAETFTARIARAANVVELAPGWNTPAWRVLGHDGASTRNSLDFDAMDIDEKEKECTMNSKGVIFRDYTMGRCSWI